MNETISLQKTTVLLALAAFVMLAFAAIPGAQAKGSFKPCADKQIKIQVDNGEGGKTKFTVPAKKVSIKGGTCAKAYEFITAFYSGEKPDLTKKYPCKSSNFAVPAGYFAEACGNGGTVIKFAARGG
jgi:hypothetical protein